MNRRNLASIVGAAIMAASSLTIGSRQTKGDMDALISPTASIDTVADVQPANAYVPTILIDPGHDVKNNGWPYKRPTKSRKEEDLNLELSKILKDSLMAHGYRVILTRDSAVGMNTRRLDLYKDGIIDKRDEIVARSNFIDSIRPDLSISIHYNANKNSRNPDWSEVFFFGMKKRQYHNGKPDRNDPKVCTQYSDNSRKIAESLTDYLNEKGRQTLVMGSDFLIFGHDVTRNMIYFEVAYLTNSADTKKWASHEGQIIMADNLKDFLVKNKEFISQLNDEARKGRDMFYIKPIPKENIVFIVCDALKDEMEKKATAEYFIRSNQNTFVSKK